MNLDHLSQTLQSRNTFSASASNGSMSSSLRQRIKREIVQNDNIEFRDKARIDTAHQNASGVLGQLYAVVLAVLVILVVAVISIVRPKLLPWNRPPVPRLVIGLLYPENISPRRDLAPVISNYAVCTPENLPARNAIRYVIEQRESLKSRAIRVVLYPREQDQAQTFAQTTSFCGDGFREKFLKSPQFMKRDLYLWCLLKMFRIQGIVEYGVNFHKSLRVYENMAIRYIGSKQQILSSLVVSSPESTVASKMLDWILSNGKDLWEESDYRQKMEVQLFRLVHDDRNTTWTLLDAVCGETGPNSTFATRM